MEEGCVKQLWCAALETVVHQVLFLRRVYPHESFCPSSFLGLRCQANRHPAVVEYISQAVQLAVSAVATGESNEVSVVLYDQETQNEHEKYSFHFSENLLCASGTTKEALESDMRNLILSVQGVEGLTIPKWSPETSFRLVVLLSSELKSCTGLKDAISEGNWFCPGDMSSQKPGRQRPVYQMSSCGCRLYAEIGIKHAQL